VKKGLGKTQRVRNTLIDQSNLYWSLGGTRKRDGVLLLLCLTAPTSKKDLYRRKEKALTGHKAFHTGIELAGGSAGRSDGKEKKVETSRVRG